MLTNIIILCVFFVFLYYIANKDELPDFLKRNAKPAK